MKTKMIALRQTYYGGVNRRKGEVFEASPEHVRILTATKAAKPVEEDTKESESKRYNRRDMRAEN